MVVVQARNVKLDDTDLGPCTVTTDPSGAVIINMTEKTPIDRNDYMVHISRVIIELKK